MTRLSPSVSLIVGAAFLALSGQSGAQPTGRPAHVGPNPASILIAQNTAQILSKEHLSQRQLDAEIASRWLGLFVKDLDPKKLYFGQDDIDGFQGKTVNLHERLRRGDLGLAYEVFKTFRERIDQRLALAKKLLAGPFDFSGDDEYAFAASKTNYARNDQETRDVWRRRIMHEILQQKADGFKDAEAAEKALRSLTTYRERISQIDEDEFVEIALSSLARAFDPKSTYLGARSWRQFQDSMRSQFDGIGAQLRIQDGACRVVRVVPGGAAQKDGRLKEGDQIVGVATDEKGKLVDVTEMRLNDIVRLLRGPRDSKVRMEVIPSGQSERLLYTLTRAPVTQTKARGVVVETRKDDGTALRVGYLLLPSLYGAPSGTTGQPCSEDVKRILVEGDQSFRARGVDMVVLDLRTNTGGLMRQATAVAELFLAERPIVQVKAANGKVETYNGEAKTASWNGPLVVLTSRQTASGTEIVAGALQSHGRALIVGESTNGIGTVQSIFEVGADTKFADPKLGVVRATTQVFYRPNGESTQKRGIVPDVELPWSIDPGAGETAQDYAIDFDRIDALRYDRFNFGIDDTLRGKLRKQSQQRREASPDFKTLSETIALTNEHNQRGAVSLNLKKYLDERTALNRLPADSVRQRRIDEAPDVDRDFYFEECLAICRDYWQELKK